MATIHKLTKDGATIFPATITDAVVHPQTGKTLTSMIKEYNVSELFPAEGIDGGNKYNLSLAIQVLNTHLTSTQKTGGIKLTFISSLSPYPTEEYFLGKSTWSVTASDWDQRFEVGDVVADPSGSWEPSTAEAYIDQQVATITGNLANETIARQTADQSLQNQINSEATTRANVDTSLQNQISTEANTRSTVDEQLRILYENLTQSDIVVGPRPSSGQLTNVIYREPDQSNTPPQNYSDYMWYNNGWVLMATYDNAIDNVPTAESNNLVKSGGIYPIQKEVFGGVSEFFNVIPLSTLRENTSINADGSLVTRSNYNSIIIENDNYVTIKGTASSYKRLPIVAFYNEEPTSESYMSSYTVFATNSWELEDYNSDVPIGCKYIVLSEDSNGTIKKATAEATKLLSGLREQLNDEISSVAGEVDTINEVVVTIKTVVDEVFEYGKPVNIQPSEFILDGYYNSNNTNRTSGYHYVSLPLLNVSEGDVIKLHKWYNTDAVANAQMAACYDSDGLPYNGTNARITYRMITTHDYVNGEFTFVIPKNCSQIGLSYATSPNQLQEGACVEIIPKISFTDSGIEMIKEAAGENTGSESVNTSEYYLKGNSNILPSNKKLGIIAAGQSNIDGRNSYSDLPSGFVNPNNKVHFCKNTEGTFSDFQITDGGSNNDWAFDAIVYDALTKSQYGNQSDIYVMKTSKGGTSIDKDGATDYHWTADYEWLPNESYSLLRTFEKTIRKGEELQGNNFEIKAMLWHQGEGDADNKDVALRYYDNFKNMLAYVRGVIGNPRLHVFCGNISYNNITTPYVSIINEAYAKLAEEDYYLHVVDMSGATLEDSYHFDYQSSIYFGQKVYDLMIDFGIITGVKINPVRPW